MGQIGNPEKEVWSEPLETPVPQKEWEPEKEAPPAEAPIPQVPEQIPALPGKPWR